MNSGSFFSSFIRYWADVFRAGGSFIRTVATGIQYLRAHSETRKEITELYPDPVSSRSADELPARTRGQIQNDIQKCTGCRDCALICPTNCIEIETEEGPKPGKLWVSVFTVDHSRCILCGLCVEKCAPQSLSHSRSHHRATRTLEEQVTFFGRGTVSKHLREQWEKMNELSGGGF